MTQDIDMNVLRAILAGAEGMVRYYETSTKEQQNAAMIAAGLPPMHTESGLKWDRQQRDEKAQQVECLKAVIAHFGGETQAEAA